MTHHRTVIENECRWFWWSFLANNSTVSNWNPAKKHISQSLQTLYSIVCAYLGEPHKCLYWIHTNNCSDSPLPTPTPLYREIEIIPKLCLGKHIILRSKLFYNNSSYNIQLEYATLSILLTLKGQIETENTSAFYLACVVWHKIYTDGPRFCVQICSI